jgi:hypothetical protein
MTSVSTLYAMTAFCTESADDLSSNGRESPDIQVVRRRSANRRTRYADIRDGSA